MTRAKTSLPAAAIVAAVLICAGAAKVQAWTNYTDEATFLSNVAAPYLVETFGSIQTGTTNPPLSFTNNGYSFGALSTSNEGSDPALYGILNGTNRWLTVNVYGNSLVFTNFSANVTAIGGYFFSTDYNEAFSNSPVKLTVQLSDLSVTNTTVTNTSTTNFIGFTFATNVTFFSIVATNVAQDIYPTAAKVILATTVPEPSSLALLLLGAGAAALLVFKKRKG